VLSRQSNAIDLQPFHVHDPRARSQNPVAHGAGVNAEQIAAIVDTVLNEFRNDLIVAAILQPQKDLAVWKVVLTRHQNESQDALTVAVDLHDGDTDGIVKASIREQILEAITDEA
jgi:hypothetical protein